MTSKNCSKCGTLKPLESYYKYKRNTDGHQSWCKICQKERTANYRLTKVGVISLIFDTQKRHSKHRAHPQPTYSMIELKSWMLNQKLYHDLYDNWEKSGHDTLLKPSCDRLDDYKPYALSNLQLMTWGDNKKKGESDRKNGINNKASKAVIQRSKDGGVISEYPSIKSAGRETGINYTCISDCCRCVQKTAGGYKWEYV